MSTGMRRFALLILILVSIPSCGKPTAPAQTESLPKPQAPIAAATAGADNSPSPVIRSDMSAEFLNAFMESTDCRGIRLSTGAEKIKADFRVLMTFAKADTPEMEEQWYWTVFDIRHDRNGQFRGAGNQDSPAEAIHDMCENVRDSFK